MMKFVFVTAVVSALFLLAPFVTASRLIEHSSYMRMCKHYRAIFFTLDVCEAMKLITLFLVYYQVAAMITTTTATANTIGQNGYARIQTTTLI